MTLSKHPVAIGCAALILSVFTGCGSSETKPVTGKITLDGVPLADAVVLFCPSKGGRTNSRGVTDSNGAYTLDYTSTAKGAIPGSYVVQIMKPEQTNRGEVETLPRIYNQESTLSADVTAGGDNVFNYELKSH